MCRKYCRYPDTAGGELQLMDEFSVAKIGAGIVVRLEELVRRVVALVTHFESHLVPQFLLHAKFHFCTMGLRKSFDTSRNCSELTGYVVNTVSG